MKLHSGDSVVVISGKDKGKTGRILRVLGNGRVVVGDINMRTKHIRAYPDRPGQIIRYEASLDASNVMFVDPKTKKRTRIGYEITEKGRKRVAKKSGEVIVGTRGGVPDKKADHVGTRGGVSVQGARRAVPDAVPDAVPAQESDASGGGSAEPKRVRMPERKPFWKRIKFGADALEEAETREAPRMKDDRSVPDQGKKPETFTHMRGE